METVPPSDANRCLRVLLAGSVGGASSVLREWLQEQGDLVVVEPPATIAEALALAATLRPDVVLLDFHGLPVSIGYIISLFKEVAPAVMVLTHDASEVMRRRCRAARVDAVFEKTEELDQLAIALRALRRLNRPPASSPTLSP